MIEDACVGHDIIVSHSYYLFSLIVRENPPTPRSFEEWNKTILFIKNYFNPMGHSWLMLLRSISMIHRSYYTNIVYVVLPHFRDMRQKCDLIKQLKSHLRTPKSISKLSFGAWPVTFEREESSGQNNRIIKIAQRTEKWSAKLFPSEGPTFIFRFVDVRSSKIRDRFTIMCNLEACRVPVARCVPHLPR